MDETQTPIEKAILLIGSVGELATALNTTPQVVTNWRARKRVPADRCRDIEALTNGAITCQQLRPDIFGEAQAA